jgi:hypothetical protein
MKPLDATREELQLRMDEAARNYARTHDQKYRDEVWRLNHRLGEVRRIAMLEEPLPVAESRTREHPRFMLPSIS